MTSQSRWFSGLFISLLLALFLRQLILGGYLFFSLTFASLLEHSEIFRANSVLTAKTSAAFTSPGGVITGGTGGNGAFTSPGVPFWHCSSWWHRSICQRYGSITHFSTCRRTSNISHAGTSAIQHCGILRTQVGSISLSATSSGTRTDSAAAAMTVTFFSSHSQRTLQTSSQSLYYSTWQSLLAIEPHALQSQCLKHQNKQTNQPTWCVCSAKYKLIP